MNARLATLAATLALGVATPSAFAQSSNAPAGFAAEVRASDALTTGSIHDARFVSSAKSGNAEQNARTVPNYGMTSGGPRH